MGLLNAGSPKVLLRGLSLGYSPIPLQKCPRIWHSHPIVPYSTRLNRNYDTNSWCGGGWSPGWWGSQEAVGPPGVAGIYMWITLGYMRLSYCKDPEMVSSCCCCFFIVRISHEHAPSFYYGWGDLRQGCEEAYYLFQPYGVRFEHTLVWEPFMLRGTNTVSEEEEP